MFNTFGRPGPKFETFLSNFLSTLVTFSVRVLRQLLLRTTNLSEQI